MKFEQNLINNCKSLDSLLLTYGFNSENLVELEVDTNISTRKIQQFWMHKVRIVDNKHYLHVGKHPLYGNIFRDTINNKFYVHKDLINSWKRIIVD